MAPQDSPPEGYDHACCALREDHEGCCAFRCSMCDGDGRCHGECGGMDDLGCDWCEGALACPECGGHGWFNEFGDQCLAPMADELPPKEARTDA